MNRVLIVIAVFALAIASAAAGSKGSANRTADASLAAADFSRDMIAWQPRIEFRQASLRVSGPSGVFERSFEAGEEIYFDFLDAAGNRLLDGTYTYELTFSPVSEAAREDGASAGIEARGSRARRSIQSGYFTLLDGMAVMPDVIEEGIRFRDQVILDDLIVDGSACIGFDCVNGESFGFDTIRIKENNLRIRAQDTSNSASFPTNDWQITFNDSANGGANKFSIDDIDGGRTPFTIEAGAPSHSLYVDDGGRIGLGTSAPVVDVHIKSGNTPTLRLEQDGSSGFTPQTWDVAGNEANFFIRDATNGSTLPFRIFPGAPSNALNIRGSGSEAGNVGLGTTSPDQSLHILKTNGTAQIFVQENIGTDGQRTLLKLENNGTVQFSLLDDSADNSEWIFTNRNGTFRIAKAGGSSDPEMEIFENGNVTIQGEITTSSGTSPFPDYVFEESYDLMSLSQLASFIEKEGHLPNIPTREDVKVSGIQITRLQLQLLEKIEELTLYTIAQDETIKQLKARMEAIEDKK
ncbi:MAG: hypothetical protein V3T83_04875 [Acidobacteriota bacterium]